jgi:hypothetical protein
MDKVQKPIITQRWVVFSNKGDQYTRPVYRQSEEKSWFI